MLLEHFPLLSMVDIDDRTELIIQAEVIAVRYTIWFHLTGSRVGLRLRSITL